MWRHSYAMVSAQKTGKRARNEKTRTLVSEQRVNTKQGPMHSNGNLTTNLHRSSYPRRLNCGLYHGLVPHRAHTHVLLRRDHHREGRQIPCSRLLYPEKSPRTRNPLFLAKTRRFPTNPFGSGVYLVPEFPTIPRGRKRTSFCQLLGKPSRGWPEFHRYSIS